MIKLLLIYLLVAFAFIYVLFPPVSFPLVFHSSKLFDPAFFSQADVLNEKYTATLSGRVSGGIIPHHLLAAPLISGFFAGLKNQTVSEVILLSPNHYGSGPNNITISAGTFTTIFGNLEPDLTRIRLLVLEKKAYLDEKLFDLEHGIYTETSFIKRAFPQALFVPLVIKNGTPQKDLDNLVAGLNKITGRNSLVLVSADFSHYQSSDTADNYDRQTISAITSFSPGSVLELNSVRNIDTPESLYVLLRLMRLKNATHINLIANSNSAKLTHQPNLKSTTSYSTMYFSQVTLLIFPNRAGMQQIASQPDPGKDRGAEKRICECRTVITRSTSKSGQLCSKR